MTDLFDPSPYTRAPILNVASAVSVGTALLAALPKKPEPRVTKAAKRLRTAVTDLQTAWAAADAQVKPEDPRPADQAIDNAYANLFSRLQAYASLDVERHPKAARAAELVALLFPNGLTFLKLPFVEEWAESQKRLDRIEAQGLAKELDLYAGKEFLAEVRHFHDAYGLAIGVTKPRGPAADPAYLGDPLRKVADAVAQYATQIAALYDPEEPATLETVRLALAPIDELRAGMAARRASNAGTSTNGTAPASPASPEVPVSPAISPSLSQHANGTSN